MANPKQGLCRLTSQVVELGLVGLALCLYGTQPILQCCYSLGAAKIRRGFRDGKGRAGRENAGRWEAMHLFALLQFKRGPRGGLAGKVGTSPMTVGTWQRSRGGW